MNLNPRIEMDEWLSPAGAASALGVSTSRIRQLSLQGRLTFEQTPMGRMYARREIEALNEERRVKARGRES